jgi:hypothetical protein
MYTIFLIHVTASAPARHVINLYVARVELHINLTEFFPTVEVLSSVDVRFCYLITSK